MKKRKKCTCGKFVIWETDTDIFVTCKNCNTKYEADYDISWKYYLNKLENKT